LQEEKRQFQAHRNPYASAHSSYIHDYICAVQVVAYIEVLSSLVGVVVTDWWFQAKLCPTAPDIERRHFSAFQKGLFGT